MPYTKKNFKPHMMHDPKTRKSARANTYAQHIALGKKGYTHASPKRKSFTDAVEARMGGGY